MRALTRTRASFVALAGLAALVGIARPARAQAWAPAAGLGSVTFVVQAIDNTGHRIFDGTLFPDGKSTDVGVDIDIDYAFTDRFSVSAALPYVFAKYRGPGGAPPGIPFLRVDECFCWHSDWQDVGFTARYNLINQRSHRGFALTPSVSAGVPSHDYAYRGEAVVGRHLKEMRIGLDAGQRLDAIVDGLSVQGSYTYAIVERVLGLPNNRSNASFEGAFPLTDKLSARGFVQWQRTHGGLRFPMDVVPFPDRVAEHDRLLKDDNVRLGAGMSYGWRRLALFASYISFVSGVNAHAGHAITVGVSRFFER